MWRGEKSKPKMKMFFSLMNCSLIGDDKERLAGRLSRCNERKH